MAKIIKGKYPYKETESMSKKKKRKLAEKEQRKLLAKQDKQLKMQCDCNHLDSKKNKSHMKISEDGTTQVCKICGGTIIRDPKLLTEASVKTAARTIYSVLSYARNNLSIDEKTDRHITEALLIVLRCPELLKNMKNFGEGKKKKNKKNNNKKNKKNKSFNRISY